MDGRDRGQASDKAGPSEKDGFRVSAPSISLPKGGGAIHGIGEKFAANPVTGTGSMTVPIYTSPGRAGFGPKLALAYDSGAGNGPFGFGWSLGTPAITRKTDKGLPRYRDDDDSDVFLLAGAEDLVPELGEDGEVVEKTRGDYRVRRYRPRIEGLFARIERWTKVGGGDTYWRTLSRDNITTIYGRDADSRIADPVDPDADQRRIFSWLVCETFDDRGNAAVYEYAREDSEGVDRFGPQERNRTTRLRSAGRYLKRIKYGYPSRLVQPDLTKSPWLFEVVFDYGEGHWEELPAQTGKHRQVRAWANPPKGRTWPVRPDAFSSRRGGFEVRTYRRCQRVLMFHRFPELSKSPTGVADAYLVRSTELDYNDFDYARGASAVQAELDHQGSTRVRSFVRRVTQCGHVQVDSVLVSTSAGVRTLTYLAKPLPPLELEYSQAVINDEIREVDAESLENLPTGIDSAQYQWVDLDGEGLSGVLTEQAGAWFYKRNVSAPPLAARGTDDGPWEARFGPLERLVTLPSPAQLSGGQQLLDLDGNGQLDVVQFGGGLPGFFERTPDFRWEPFTPFSSLPNVSFGDPNTKFVDLTGDGHADLLIAEDGAFTWYPSLGVEGFGPAERVRHALDEEESPRAVFADGTQSIYLADMSGDGLSDVVRIRNGEICYWPNLGYGRFGPKVTMDDSPWFDAPDLFDQRRVRLADVDGSGTVDVLYLRGDRVSIYFNCSGNSFTEAGTVPFPRIDNLSSVNVVDLLGNGTACLAWSSPLPADAGRPLRYIDLMGGQKPHLLVGVKNNLGAETRVTYAPSTKFYLADKLAGKPWITRLPFPVHCVERVTVRDTWRNTEFSATTSYHHGYFDGEEREFRGFGRVEQTDIQRYDRFAAANAASPYVTDDLTLYQPPVKTVTWYHTGAFLDRERILSHFRGEYFPAWFEDQHPGSPPLLGGFEENVLPEPDIREAADLSSDEWREALRACKGMVLRQEVYELDVDAFHDTGEERPVTLFSTAYHNCSIRRLQAKGDNLNAVFLVTESEAITYHYELDLRPSSVRPDPRITHTLNLSTDRYGNVLQAITVVYGRLGRHVDASLPAGTEDLIAEVQSQRHLTYVETRLTEDLLESDDDHRLRLPCEVLTYELANVEPEGTYFRIEELRALSLSPSAATDPDYLAGTTAVAQLAYHETPSGVAAQKRLVEHVRSLYFDVDLRTPLPLGESNALALPYETYKLALTEGLLARIFGAKLTTAVRNELADPTRSGYAADDTVAGQYWVRSGVAGFATDAADHFFLPERYTDPFGNVTSVEYDDNGQHRYDLFIQSSEDPAGNTTVVERFDFRVLAPARMKDANDNVSSVVFDVLGMPTAMAMSGKVTGNVAEADTLDGFGAALVDPGRSALSLIFQAAPDRDVARTLLGDATIRSLYHFGETYVAGEVSWCSRPAATCAIAREVHAADDPNGDSPLQIAFECSDGHGNVLLKRAQAEPDPDVVGGPLRWIVSGKTVVNNKGNPVKQYEPYFSAEAVCRGEGDVHEEVGVTPLIYYDALGRVVRTEMPDGTFSRVAFSPWHVSTYDANDTVLDSGWYADRTPPAAAAKLPVNVTTGEPTVAPDRRAAWLGAQHADTPAVSFLDSLGRDVVAVTHNRTRFPDDATAGVEEKGITFTKLDTEGKPLWIRDARGNLVMQFTRNGTPAYDITGTLLFQHSMDAGDRWMLNDAAGKAMFAWDFNQRQDGGAGLTGEARVYETRYDGLHRPIEQWLTINGAAARMIERFEYVDAKQNVANARARNLCGQIYRRYDPSGRVQVERLDFKGSRLEVQRRLASDPQASVVDWQSTPEALLDPETFVQLTDYDALGRMTRLYNWHRPTTPQRRVAVYEPRYGERGLLVAEQIVVGATRNAATSGKRYDEGPGARRRDAILEVRHDAKGQKTLLKLGNGAITRYDYDEKTFRLRQLRTTRLRAAQTEPSFPGFSSSLADGRVLQQLHYEYDPVGNVTEIHDDAYQPVFFRNQVVQPRSRYVYDATYRLIEATGREGYLPTKAPSRDEPPPGTATFPATNTTLRNYRQRYAYDVVGNISEMRHVADQGNWRRWYDYATDSNRLAHTWEGASTRTATTATRVVTYDHDDHGNLRNLDQVTVAENLRWDHRDMLRALDRIGGGWMSYQYDAGKLRTRKVCSDKQSGAKQWERLSLGGMELYRVYSGTGRVVEEIETHHLFEAETRVLLAEDVITTNTPGRGVGALFRYQYGNHLGSACLELDAAADVITYEEYHPYGTTAYRAARSATEAPKRYRYSGMERDEESGLGYHAARHHAPWLGRWTACDPAGTKDGLNIYLHARGNPIRFVDVSGRQSIASQIEKIESPVGWFLAKTGYDLWNVVSLGTLEKTEAQDNLGTWEGLGESSFTAVRAVSNTASLGLQDRIYETQMAEGPGLNSIVNGIAKAGEDMLPIAEADVLADPDASASDKWRAGTMALTKVANLVAAGASLTGKTVTMPRSKGGGTHPNSLSIEKVQAINQKAALRGKLRKTAPPKNIKQRRIYEKKHGKLSKQYQPDHIQEMQLGGPPKDVNNLAPLDAPLNRSAGPTIQGEIRTHRMGQRYDRVLIQGERVPVPDGVGVVLSMRAAAEAAAAGSGPDPTPVAPPGAPALSATPNGGRVQMRDYLGTDPGTGVELYITYPGRKPSP